MDYPFKRHKEIEEETPDEMTKQMYNADKDTLRMIHGKLDLLPERQRKHIETIKEFVDGYEASVIKHWWNFFLRGKALIDYYERNNPMDAYSKG